ncbi:hypothetical protein ABZ234_07845 [Nocardiopsis sp. NPDC006198]|uniref:hypothetical protein n=1 Tax=Nocardiopsis sp. NPDC006198 TaxID=3154472 RepID=UPI0033B2FBC6
MRKLRYFAARLRDQGPVHAAMHLTLLACTVYHAVSLLLWEDSGFILAAVLIGALVLAGRVADWWPPRCECGRRLWDGPCQDHPEDDSFGMAA